MSSDTVDLMKEYADGVVRELNRREDEVWKRANPDEITAMYMAMFGGDDAE